MLSQHDVCGRSLGRGGEELKDGGREGWKEEGGSREKREGAGTESGEKGEREINGIKKKNNPAGV